MADGAPGVRGAGYGVAVSTKADRVPPGDGDRGSMEDIEEIRKLKARYFRMLDQQDWQGVSEVFSPDAQIDVSSSTVSGSSRGVYSSRDSFIDTVSRSCAVRSPSITVTTPRSR